LLREFLSVFYGNELVIGIVLGNWMIITGLGSYFGKFSEKIKNQNALIILLSILLGTFPLVTVYLLRYLRYVVFLTGEMIGIYQIIYSSLILLLPFCIVSGFAFSLLAVNASAKNESNLISKVYSVESLGSLVGGFLFSVVLIFFLSTFQSLKLLLFKNFFVTVILVWKNYGKIIRTVTVLILVFITVVLCLSDFDYLTRKYLFPEQQIIFYKDTPYGNLTITEQGGQKNFFENGTLLFSTNDAATNEEAVHYAMIQHQNPKYVLLVGRGISGITNEILKYNVDRVDYVEINPWIIKAGEQFTNSLKDKRINVVSEDARMFVRKTSGKYDVILVNLPEPLTAQFNRFYTEEFFVELKRRLNSDAVVSLSLLPATDYVSAKAGNINSTIYNTLKTSFKNILIVPGLKDFYLASDSKLNINIGKMISERGINNLYVNQYYLDDGILSQRSQYLQSRTNKTSYINKDFNPVSYYLQLVQWLDYFEFNYWIPAVIILVIIFFALYKTNLVGAGIFCAGFSASSIEVILLISFQIIYGYVYQVTGIIITIFMAGLAAGSKYYEKIIKKNDLVSFSKVQFSLAVYFFLFPLIMQLLSLVKDNVIVVHSVFYLMTFSIALLTGGAFALATKIEKGKVSSIVSRFYSIDLIGSALGALLVSALFIPLIGVNRVAIIIGAVNFVAGVFSFAHKKKELTLH
jgi:spermidine synthase